MSFFDRLCAATLSKAVNAYRMSLRRNRADVQELFNRRGIFFQPTGYYSSQPSPSEVAESFEYRSGPPPYSDTGIFAAEVIVTHMSLLAEYAHEFDPPADGDMDNPDGYFLNNDLFGGLDALAYYCSIRHAKPQTVIEIGSGFSTLVARQALAKNGSGTLICIEPYPRPWLERVADRVERTIVQNLPPSWFTSRLMANDILFIDSSHTVKAGSDCLYEYLLVVPRLAPGVYVHAHDIFLPEGMPAKWLTEWNFTFTEQYLLLALLIENPRCEAVFGGRYTQIAHADELRRFAGKFAGDVTGSFWFRRR